MAALDARKLEAALIATFGPDFRDKVIVGLFDSFRLADAFEECGLVDPQARPPAGPAYGLWQTMPSSLVLNETCAKRGGKCDCGERPCKLDAVSADDDEGFSDETKDPL